MGIYKYIYIWYKVVHLEYFWMFNSERFQVLNWMQFIRFLNHNRMKKVLQLVLVLISAFAYFPSEKTLDNLSSIYQGGSIYKHMSSLHVAGCWAAGQDYQQGGLRFRYPSMSRSLNLRRGLSFSPQIFDGQFQATSPHKLIRPDFWITSLKVPENHSAWWIAAYW